MTRTEQAPLSHLGTLLVQLQLDVVRLPCPLLQVRLTLESKASRRLAGHGGSHRVGAPSCAHCLRVDWLLWLWWLHVLVRRVLLGMLVQVIEEDRWLKVVAGHRVLMHDCGLAGDRVVPHALLLLLLCLPRDASVWSSSPLTAHPWCPALLLLDLKRLAPQSVLSLLL